MLKGKNDAPPMSFHYHLERQANKWVVVLATDSAHGGAGAADPNTGGGNPHGGAMPPGHAWRRHNPHGGMAPAGGAGSMPSPHDLPPATKK